MLRKQQAYISLITVALITFLLIFTGYALKDIGLIVGGVMGGFCGFAAWIGVFGREMNWVGY